MAVLELVSLPATGAAGANTRSHPERRKWTGDDLIRMGELGLLPPEGRFELLDGEIYELMPPGPLHSFLTGLIAALIEAELQDRDLHTREEKPIRLSSRWDPQPDVAVVIGPRHRYRSRFPRPDEVRLVVEVALSSVEYDHDLKLPGYAAAGIQECWVVNLPAGQLEVYREPVDDEYRSRRLYRSGEVVEPLAIPGSTLEVTELLGGTDEPDGTDEGA